MKVFFIVIIILAVALFISLCVFVFSIWRAFLGLTKSITSFFPHLGEQIRAEKDLSKNVGINNNELLNLRRSIDKVQKDFNEYLNKQDDRHREGID